MTEFATFGDPSRFEIAVRWTADGEPRARRPADHGWSMGDLRITIGERVVTTSRRGAATENYITWYLSPFLSWLAQNWAFLLHEEEFAWTEKSAAPAAVACHRAMEDWIAAEDDFGKSRYRAAQGWYRRHALRSVSEGGLFPDLFIRRFVDDIELSWIADAPLFAPGGFTFVTDPGFARLVVSDVGAPLWEALTWAASTPPPHLQEEDRKRHAALARQVEQIRSLTPLDFECAHVSREIIEMVRHALAAENRLDLVDEHVERGRPFIDVLSPAVAMYGGVSPRLNQADVEGLRSVLVETAGGAEAAELAALVSDARGAPLGVRPHEDGYRLAEELLEILGKPGDADFVDVRAICERLEIYVLERALVTDTIRGVALAGDGFRPTILVNTTSAFNANSLGRRFTIAHELCHVLHDRGRARRVAHVSGPWVAPGIEKRANAFGAFLLMPRSLVLRLLDGESSFTDERIAWLANLLQVNETPLIEHLYNIDLINEWDRERLRAAFRRH
jgi:Zn-dependent peptidase ImmA (M78 family)